VADNGFVETVTIYFKEFCMKRFFWLAALMALVSAAGMVFAGGGGQQSAGQGAPAANRTITINVGSSVGGEAGWKAVAAEYMKKNPDVNVVVDLKAGDGYAEWVQSVYNTANPVADIVLGNLAGSMAMGKSINFLEYADLKSPYSNGAWRDQFNFKAQDFGTGGEMIFLNLDSVQVFWAYNKDIFDKVGVKPPRTWNELIAVCEKLQAAGYQPIAMPGDFDSFYGGTMGWIARIYTDQTTRSLINVYRSQPGDYNYDPDVDGVWKYDPTDPYNDDASRVNVNWVRVYKSVIDGVYKPDSEGIKTLWTNIAKVFPKYAGGDAMFGTKDPLPLFYQGKAAMMMNGGWFLMQFKNDMDKLAKGQEITSGDNAITGVTKFTLGTFNNPSFEGPGIEAPARTIEMPIGFISALKKDKAHDDLVVDFLMYYSSKEGMSAYLSAGINAGLNLNGPSLVYGVTLPPDIQVLFDNLSFVGNSDKGFGILGGWGVQGSGGDIMESMRAFYDYSYSYLSGKTNLDQWLASHKANILQYIPVAMEQDKISMNDLKNPQNAPTGQ
jgi:ABC-type glycerol-3-phosphate transport system substrate-binding protein